MLIGVCFKEFIERNVANTQKSTHAWITENSNFLLKIDFAVAPTYTHRRKVIEFYIGN